MTGEATSRRSFLGKLFAGTMFAAVSGMIASTLAYLLPSAEVSSSLGPRRSRVGQAGDLGVGQGRLILVDEEPVWIVRLPGGFAALSAVCTHKGCVIQWDQERRLFTCPCHEGLFDERGNVVAGLPLRPLPHFRVSTISGEVYVSREDDGES